MPLSGPLDQEVTTALQNDDLAAIITALAKRGSGENAIGADPGTAKVGDIVLAAKLIRTHFKSKPARLFAWVKQLLANSDFSANQRGLVLLSDVYTRDPKKAQQWLQCQADSPNWAVREYAGTCAGRILMQSSISSMTY